MASQKAKRNATANIKNASITIPMIIKKNLTIAPNILNIKFENLSSRNFPISKPLLEDDELYLFHGEKKVFSINPMEK